MKIGTSTSHENETQQKVMTMIKRIGKGLLLGVCYTVVCVGYIMNIAFAIIEDLIAMLHPRWWHDFPADIAMFSRVNAEHMVSLAKSIKEWFE